MGKENLILITMDAVRPDHLSCYGYDKIRTSNIDFISEEGALFEECICSSCLTPVSHASILTGNNPPTHRVRHPFCKVGSKMISEILGENGYKTAGFVGINFLSSQHGFNAGFDYFDEPTEESSWNKKEYRKGEKKMNTLWGNWWVDRMLKWLKECHSANFFIWGHYFEVHFLAEKYLLSTGEIESGKLHEHAYYDAKIKYMDEKLFGPLINILKDLKLWENTTIVVTSDHGEKLGPRYPSWEDFYTNYPQHKTLYDYDLKVPLIIKNKRLGKRKRVKQTVRAIDLVPTLVDLLDISISDKFDGESLMPLIHGEKFHELTAYAEELYEERGEGSLQAVRTSEHKLIRNITKNTEKLYNLRKDPKEKENVINTSDAKEKIFLQEFRETMDIFLQGYETETTFTEEEKNKIEDRLRALGYIG